MENPDRRGQDPSASSEQVRTPLEKQRDFADAQPAGLVRILTEAQKKAGNGCT